MDKKIILNEKELTEEEFLKEKQEIEKQKGVTLVEVSPDVYKIRIQG